MSNINDTISVSPYTSFPHSKEEKKTALEGLFGNIKKVSDLFRKQITTNSSIADEGCRPSAENTEKTPQRQPSHQILINDSLNPHLNRKELEKRITACSCGVRFESIKEISNRDLYARYVDLGRFGV